MDVASREEEDAAALPETREETTELVKDVARVLGGGEVVSVGVVVAVVCADTEGSVMSVIEAMRSAREGGSDLHRNGISLLRRAIVSLILRVR